MKAGPGAWALAAALACRGAAFAAEPAAPGPTGDWNFQVSLDGKPIGQHRFTVTGQGSERRVRSVARFDVKLLGLTVYRYRHHADEQWQGGCLVGLQASTDDDGKASTVTATRSGDTADAPLVVTRPDGREQLPGCVMSFAYWHPAMQTRTRLLNPQTGRFEAVQISEASPGTVEVHGQAVEARRVQLSGPKDPIELWYSPLGQWLALDSQVGSRRLSYRLE